MEAKVNNIYSGPWAPKLDGWGCNREYAQTRRRLHINGQPLNNFRAWTFAMSCCISSAICCVLMTSSLSGIALGYNYSLAEYIDLKETNVSVYLKRGVFDDEIADDMEWRRAGHMPVAGHINEDNLVTAAQDSDEIPDRRSGRKLDDSVFESNDNHKFEGSLMKLTAKPLDAPITPLTYTPDLEMGEVHAQTSNELDKLKAIQGILNMRRFNAMGSSFSTESGRRMFSDSPRIPQNRMRPTSSVPPQYLHAELIAGRRFDPHDPQLYQMLNTAPTALAEGRRFDPNDPQLHLMLNPARTAVPESDIGASVYWKTRPPYATTKETLFLYNEIYPVRKLSTPGPIPLKLEPRRPSAYTGITSGRRAFTGPPLLIFTEGNKAESVKDKDYEGMKSGEETDRLSQNMRLEMSREKPEDYPLKGDEDYELDAKGLPIRKRRHIENGSGSFSTPPSLSSPIVELSLSSEVFRTETKFTTHAPALLYKLMSTLIQ